jgi:site-specific DNA-methyltransferase (cytosine-N4-specific)
LSQISGFKPYYTTANGEAYLGDSLALLERIESDSIDLIMTSPPFALQRQKAYGNKPAVEYINWFVPFAIQFKRVLRSKGSLVIDLGGSWVQGKPEKSLYQYELLVRLCKDKELQFHLAQDLYWFNKAKLPGPAQWVTVNRWRLKDAVNQIFWLSKSSDPKADNKKVLKEYSDAMKDLLGDRSYYKPNVSRPSEHKISEKFYNGNGGAIHPNFFLYSNTDSQSKYIRLCRQYQIKAHPARFPIQLPSFFIKFLTEEGNTVLDPFAGSNVTGEAAEKLGRKWISIEKEESYVQASLFRFFLEETLENQYGFKKKDTEAHSASII